MSKIGNTKVFKYSDSRLYIWSGFKLSLLHARDSLPLEICMCFFIFNAIYFKKCWLQIILLENPHFRRAVELTIQIKIYMKSNLNF